MSPRYRQRSFSRQLQRIGPWIALIAYLGGLLIFLGAELGVPWLVGVRATNQRILIFVLIFLPFVLPAAISAVRTLSLKVSGQELQLELRETREKLHDVAGEFSLQIGNAEAIFAPLLGGADPGRADRLARRELVVGSKASVSAELLGEVLAAQIERRLPDVTVHRRIPNGSTLRNLAHLQQGWIDCYVEFTGTACEFHNLPFRGKTPEELRGAIDALARERYDAAWLPLMGLRDNYYVAMRADRARELKVTTLSDLAALSRNLAFAGYVEFLNRADGYDGLKRAYGMDFARVVPCDVDDLFDCLDAGRADAVVSQESDPELATEVYTALADDRGHFPDYHAAPVVRVSALEAIDGLEACLAELRDRLDTAAMSAMVRERLARGEDRAIRESIARRFVASLG